MNKRERDDDELIPIHATPLAVTVPEAARMVGVSRAHFYKLYVDSGRVRPVKQGKRLAVIDVEELRGAYRRLVEEARAAQ